MRPSSSAVLASLFLASSCLFAQKETPRFEQLDPSFKKLFPPGASLEKVASGFTWTEGPVWTTGGYLLFAEIPSNSIRKLLPGGDSSIWLQPSGYKGSTPYNGPEPGSNGMTLDAKGRLSVAGHALRSVWRLETLDPKGQVTTLAESYQGKKLNSPNDLVYRSDGSLYFTDPPYGNRTQSDKDKDKELTVNGVYRIKGAAQHSAGAPPDNSQLELLIKDLPRPNGIAFSPDEKTLYVSDSEPKLWMKYPVGADGSLGKGVVLQDSSQDKTPGSPDGMKVDVNGNLFSSGPGGIWVFAPSGKHIGTLLLPEPSGNIAFGDADRKTLYIADKSSIFKIRVNYAGLKPATPLR